MTFSKICSTFVLLASTLTLSANEDSPIPKLLDLGAKKCVPCKMMEPVLADLAMNYRGQFDVEFIDVWQPENRTKATFYKINSIPTQIFFDETGKELWRHEGYISKEDILKAWDALGFVFENPILSSE
ncbi:MAG: thioredoxin family protein [Opitutales bacterium]|nr:thioredoxin family protein [Opitutales bacterium]